MRARKFLNAMRFIDDECNLNDAKEFSKSFQEIYPSHLQLKCEHEGIHATFLELDILVEENIFKYTNCLTSGTHFHSRLYVCQISLEIFHQACTMIP